MKSIYMIIYTSSRQTELLLFLALLLTSCVTLAKSISQDVSVFNYETDDGLHDLLKRGSICTFKNKLVKNLNTTRNIYLYFSL